MTNTALKIAIITGSTRPGRVNKHVADWAYNLAKDRTDATFELVDIADFNLPLFDEPVPPSITTGSNPHTVAWSTKIAEFDGFIFISPEYNHSISGALKNAIDYLFKEWGNKAAGLVSYGGAGGARAAEHLRLVLANVDLVTVRSQVLLSLFTDFENFTKFNPAPHHKQELQNMLDQLILWGEAFKSLRTN